MFPTTDGAERRPSRRRWARACGVTVGLVFLVALGAKVANPDGFKRTLVYLTGWEEPGVFLLGMGVLLAECGVGLALVLSRRPRLAGIAAIVTLLVFTAAIGVLLSDPQASACACTGELLLVKSTIRANQLSLARNGLLLALAAASLCTARPPESA